MNSLGLILVAVIGFVIAGALTALLSGRRAHWSSRRRVLVASVVAPMLIVAGVLASAVLTLAEGSGMGDLVIYALVNVGLIGATVAFVSGLIASMLADRALRSS